MAWPGDVEMEVKGKTVRAHRWYFGGLASAGAAVFTHPLDLLKVNWLS